MLVIKSQLNILKRGLLIASLCFLIFDGYAAVFPKQTFYQVCFTPYEPCTREIVQQINQAKHSINMQAYSFTSRPIAHALVRAHRHGVKVKVILDKSNFNCDRFSFGSYLIRHGIPVWNDSGLTIAHSKVMIFDRKIVETGSFNYTKAAQYHNAENVLIIKNEALAKAYLNNWVRREKVSKLQTTDVCKHRYYY